MTDKNLFWNIQNEFLKLVIDSVLLLRIIINKAKCSFVFSLVSFMLCHLNFLYKEVLAS